MNKFIGILILFLLTIGHLQAQTLEEKVRILEEENEHLKRELAKCKGVHLSNLLNNIETQKYPEEPNYSREELHEIILQKIRTKSENKYEIAIEIIKQTDRFLKFCEDITSEMIERSGGLDTIKNRPKGCRNKDIVNKVLMEEGKGIVLKKNIIQLRAEYIRIVKNNTYYMERITLDEPTIAFYQEADSSWEAYNFKNMPLCGLMPLLANFKNKAKKSEIAVLQYLKK